MTTRTHQEVPAPAARQGGLPACPEHGRPLPPATPWLRQEELPARTASVSDALRLQYAAERAHRHAVLTSIQQQLEEQPSPRAVRAAARHWSSQILAMADTIASSMERS